MHLESIGNSTFDVSPKKTNSTELRIDQSGDRNRFEQIAASNIEYDDRTDFDWSAINIEKIGSFKESTPLRCSEYNPIRSEIAVGSNGSCLRIFQVQNPSQSMEPILTLNKVHEASIYCCDYAFNGEYMATGSNDKGKKTHTRMSAIWMSTKFGCQPFSLKHYFSHKNYASGLQPRIGRYKFNHDRF